MSRFNVAIANISAVALSMLSGAAIAQEMPFHGVVGGAYANSDGTDAWAATASLIFNGGPGFGAEGVVGYGSDLESNLNVDVWTVGGGIFYRTMDFAIGGGVEHSNVDVGPFNNNTTNYGVAGEAYLSNNFTLSAGGGGFSAGGGDGWTIGGSGTVYPIPNLAFNAGVGYSDAGAGSGLTNYGAGVEFLPFSSFPASIIGDYTRAEGGGASVDVFTIGILFYLGTPGDGTLVSNHRHGGVYLSNGIK